MSSWPCDGRRITGTFLGSEISRFRRVTTSFTTPLSITTFWKFAWSPEAFTTSTWKSPLSGAGFSSPPPENTISATTSPAMTTPETLPMMIIPRRERRLITRWIVDGVIRWTTDGVSRWTRERRSPLGPTCWGDGAANGAGVADCAAVAAAAWGAAAGTASMTVSPIWIVPAPVRMTVWIGLPFTSVPFDEPRSWTETRPSGSCWIRACLREAFWSSSTMSQSAPRPRTTPLRSTSKAVPALLPARTWKRIGRHLNTRLPIPQAGLRSRLALLTDRSARVRRDGRPRGQRLHRDRRADRPLLGGDRRRRARAGVAGGGEERGGDRARRRRPADARGDEDRRARGERDGVPALRVLRADEDALDARARRPQVARRVVGARGSRGRADARNLRARDRPEPHAQPPAQGRARAGGVEGARPAHEPAGRGTEAGGRAAERG